MKNWKVPGNMKNQARALLIAIGFTLASVGPSAAMSALILMSKEAVWPASPLPDGNVVYSVTTVGRAGSGLLEVALSADGMPPGVTVTFSPSILRFTGNGLVAQTATMTVSCPGPIPVDCFPFTITGTALRETVSITNQVSCDASYVAVRPPTLMLDQLADGSLRLRGLGATGKTYRVEVSPSLTNPAWTPAGSTTADGNGRLTFFTSPAPDSPVRFFRAVTTSDPVVSQ
jgi:hypothetical protein